MVDDGVSGRRRPRTESRICCAEGPTYIPHSSTHHLPPSLDRDCPPKGPSPQRQNPFAPRLPSYHPTTRGPSLALCCSVWRTLISSGRSRPPSGSMTPPRVSLSNMSSGNFDFPPASSSPDGQGHLSTYHRLLQAHQRDHDAAQRDLQQESERQLAQDLDDITSASRSHQRPAASTPSMPRRNRRATRGSSRPLSHMDDGNRSQLVAPPQDPLRISAIRNRPHAEPSQRFSALRRVRQQREQTTRNSGLADLEQAGERLTEISQGLSQLIGNSSSQMFRVELEDADDGTGQRRFKRRKLDRDDSSSLPSIRYGHFGQVVPGRLRMEIVSCDGGEFNDSTGDLHKVENVLKNDASVYCTKRSNCNLLLRHQGETNFSLDKLVIKAPDYGFTSPYV